MTDEAKKEELLKRLSDGVLNFEEDDVIAAANEVIELGLDAYEAIMNGLSKGMNEAGRLWDEEEYFVPELLLCADALYAGLDILKPNVKLEDQQNTKGVVVIGTVQGDVHDIGKNLVKMMLESNGFNVVDIGVDVSADSFVSAVHEYNADIVGISALLTITMTYMPKVVEALKQAGLKQKARIMIGGAPITREFADSIDVEGFAEDCASAVDEAMRLMKL